MWIYCNLFVTNDSTDSRKVIKLQFFKDKAYSSKHALRRVQTFDTIIPIAPDPYWLFYDREISAKRKASHSMSLPSFATFFIHMESRWLDLMRLAIEEAGGNEETVMGFNRFCDAFEDRYSRAIARYTDLGPNEHDYAWLCLLYANQIQPEALLTRGLLS